MWARKDAGSARPLSPPSSAPAPSGPDDPLFADYDAFVAEGGEALQALRDLRGDLARAPRRGLAALARRLARRATRRRSPRSKRRARRRRRASRCSANGSPTGSSPRPPARASAAGWRSASIATSRSARRPTARRAGRARRNLMQRRQRRRAARSVLDARARYWNLPPPDPVAGAREGWSGLRRALRRQHAPRRHAAHRPRDGADAAVRHPRRRQARRGRLCRLSRRRPDRPDRAGEPAPSMHGRRRGPRHRARRFSRKAHPGATSPACGCCGSSATASSLRDPKQYPALSVACASTHDLPTLAGWWRGADIAERLSLGLSASPTPSAPSPIAGAEKREMLAALRARRRAGAGSDRARRRQ